MANLNAGKQVGEPCGYCGQPLTQGQNGAYCKPCYIAYKNKKSQPQPPRSYQTPQPPQVKSNQNEDIRANVALKMTSELIAAGKAELKDWKKLADTFYHYKPAFTTPPVSPAREIASTRKTGDEQVYEEPPTPGDGYDEGIIVNNIPF